VLTSITYTLKGVAFRINTGPNSYPGFRGLTQATFVNTGVYAPPYNVSDYFATNFQFLLDVTAGQSGDDPAVLGAYYLTQVQAGLTQLGVNVPTC